jgi:hypothetical protein
MLASVRARGRGYACWRSARFGVVKVVRTIDRELSRRVIRQGSGYERQCGSYTLQTRRRIDAVYLTGLITCKTILVTIAETGAHLPPICRRTNVLGCCSAPDVITRRWTTVGHNKGCVVIQSNHWWLSFTRFLTQRASTSHVRVVRPTFPGSLSSLRALHARTMLPCLYLYILRFTSCIA